MLLWLLLSVLPAEKTYDDEFKLVDKVIVYTEEIMKPCEFGESNHTKKRIIVRERRPFMQTKTTEFELHNDPDPIYLGQDGPYKKIIIMDWRGDLKIQRLKARKIEFIHKYLEIQADPK
jgi:hypothetical protein